MCLRGRLSEFFKDKRHVSVCIPAAWPASSRTRTCNHGDVRFHSFSTVIYISNVTSQLREAEKQHRSSINQEEKEDAEKVELFIKAGTQRFGQQEREREGSDASNTVACSALLHPNRASVEGTKTANS